MKSVPAKIYDAKVLYSALIDKQIQPTGNCKHTVGGVLQGPASGLAICQYEGTEGFYLFGCDEDWHCVTDTFHDTVEEAMSQAEFEYAGVSKIWQHTQAFD